MNNEQDLEKLNRMAFSIISITQINCSTGWKKQESCFNKNSIIYVTKGRGNLQIDKTAFYLEKNKCFLLVPNMSIYLDTNSHDPLQYYEIDFDYIQYNEKQVDKSSFPFSGEIPIHNTIEVVNLLNGLLDVKPQLMHLEQLRKNALLHQLIYLCAYQVYKRFPILNIKAAIETTVRYMDIHFDQEVTREELATMIGFNVDYYSRVFKKEVGVSPNEYLTQIRIKRAKEYLVTSNQRLKEIAKSVGYSDPFYFSRIFKKSVGVSPTIYVKKNKKRIATFFARDIEVLLTLGTTPIAATKYIEGEFDTIFEYNESLKKTKIVDLGPQETPSLKALQEVEPDLIILTNWHEISEEVCKIAPTVKLDTNGWDRFEELAVLLGKEAEAEAFKERYERKLTEAKSSLKKYVKESETTLFISIYDGTIGVTDRYFIFNQLLYDKLGLTPPPDVIPKEEQVYITAQRLAEINPDYLFVTIHNQRFYDEIFSNVSVQQINAFKNDRVYVIHHSFVRNIKGVSLAIDLIVESMTR
ncbi:ABC transporter substrate-binding protein [Sutcliffiella horikoshii]|uniref:ABC transporter substrate-binding protein n=1 Tax=Sutcliffiella horikoshii TaxID=79883 RepID=A0A5D4S768_9BACI|nr:ABC transporter substrate-binding protein [Sutcliffiella horikoshii]TYS59535.1 ABC transporter substrate-binding protein [Sutcliffiella horikoshii]